MKYDLKLEDIKKFIDKEYNIDIATKSNSPNYSYLRFCYYYICVKYLVNYNYEQIGFVVGTDHSSVTYGMKKITSDVGYNSLLTEYYNNIIYKFNDKFKKTEVIIDHQKIDKLEDIKIRRKYIALRYKYKNKTEEVKRLRRLISEISK